jgi:hypothetical protein
MPAKMPHCKRYRRIFSRREELPAFVDAALRLFVRQSGLVRYRQGWHGIMNQRLSKDNEMVKQFKWRLGGMRCFAVKSKALSGQCLLSLLFLLGCASTAQAAIPAAERAVLMDIYTSTNGASWTANANWNGAVGTECSWVGITCDATQSRVTAIWLEFNNLAGTLPSLSGLTALQDFVVRNNQLTGPIPSLNGLTALQVFNVSSNQLSGSIPSLSG